MATATAKYMSADWSFAVVKKVISLVGDADWLTVKYIWIKLTERLFF